jgi:hypothetical protein
LESPAHCRRVGEARSPCRQGHRSEVHAQAHEGTAAAGFDDVGRVRARAPRRHLAGDSTDPSANVPADEDARTAARAAVKTAAGRSLLFLLALHAVPIVAMAGLTEVPASKVLATLLDVAHWVVLIAIALDLAEEWRARAAFSNWSIVAVEHRVYAARALLWGLERRGMTAFARGLATRSCFHFFGPYIPIEIVVHANDSDRASTLIDCIRRAARTEEPAEAAIEPEPATGS